MLINVTDQSKFFSTVCFGNVIGNPLILLVIKLLCKKYILWFKASKFFLQIFIKAFQCLLLHLIIQNIFIHFLPAQTGSISASSQ